MHVQSCRFATINLLLFLPSLLKLPIVVLKRFFYHGNVTSYFSPLYKYRALEFYKLKSNVIPSEVGNRGYYMATRRYEISLRVLKIFHE